MRRPLTGRQMIFRKDKLALKRIDGSYASFVTTSALGVVPTSSVW